MAIARLREDFEPHLGKSFRFPGWHGVLRLAAIQDVSVHGVSSDMRPPFVAIFQGPPNNVLAQGVYDAATDDGVELCFHIMPIHTPAADRQDYQALFA